MPKELTWRKAIEKVLSQAAGAMHYKDLTDKIIEDGLRVSLGATPTRTVNAHLTTAIKKGRAVHSRRQAKGCFSGRLLEPHRYTLFLLKI